MIAPDRTPKTTPVHTPSSTLHTISRPILELFLYGSKKRGFKITLLIGLFTSILFNSIVGMQNMKRRILCSHIMHIGGQRQLSEECATMWGTGTGEPIPLEELFPLRNHGNGRGRGGNTPVSPLTFVVVMPDCGDESMSAFLDSGAVMKHSVSCSVPRLPTGTTATGGDNLVEGEEGGGGDGGEDVTMWAIMHPDAVHCMGPNGEEYDRAVMMMKLGYYVKIWDLPVDEGMLVDQPYIKSNVTDSGVLQDLMALHALKLTNHEFAIVLDQNFILQKPLDTIFSALRTTNDVLAYVTDPSSTGVSTDILVLKPSVETFDELVDAFVSVPYTEDGGWGGTGIGLYPGGMGTSGLLDYYLNAQPRGPGDPSGMLLDRCRYANNADEECKTFPFEEITGYVMSDEVCGQPWMCTWGDEDHLWDDVTSVMCMSFLVHWIQGREEIQTFFFNQPTNDGTGDYHAEIYHGLCTTSGPEGYIPMLADTVPAQENCLNDSLEFHGCDPTLTDTTRTSLGSGYYIDVALESPTQCQVFTAEPNNAGAVIPFVGTAHISGEATADTSMVFVIDRSGSTCDVFGLRCSSDENYDLQYDDVLDCEIAAILDLVEKVRSEGTVNYVGLVSFAHKVDDVVSATVELPLTDINVFDENEAHAIENSIRAINCGGATNYAAAVEKACEVIDGSTTEHNVVVMISDGEPTRGGAPANYCANNAVFHTVALGEFSTCSGGEDTSLMDIALATSGTCQEVIDIPDIKMVLQEIGTVQFLSIVGHTVASEGSVNFGCADVPNFMTSINIKCADIGPFCGEYLASAAFANGLDQTGDSACCVCGGGVYLDVGDLATVGDPDEPPPAGFMESASFEDSAIMHEGAHRVCTTVVAAEAGVPGVNEQCRDILVCPASS